MDNTTRIIAEFAASQRYESISPAAVAATIRHHLDGIGCAAGGFESEPCHVTRGLASAVNDASGASVFGVAAKSTAEYATFANASAVRHLDFNDTYLGGKGGGGRPNDMAPAIFAAVEMTGGSGKDLINGLYIAYEVFGGLSNAIRFRGKGIDQGISVSLGTAAAVAKILGLGKEGIANAIAMAIVPSIPVRVTRAGELSHWKGCATAHASMTAMFGARLARAGMTGPSQPFEGFDGVWNLSGAFDLSGLGRPVDGKSAIERTAFKYFPAEFNSQGPITLLLKLREQFGVEDIEQIDIHSYHLTWHEIGGGQGDVAEKWDPKTRESADHSLPYLAAVALKDGQVTLKSFTDERVRDPALRPLMKKIAVKNDTTLQDHWAATSEPKSRIEIRLKDGRQIREEVSNFRGHTKNPMNDDEIRFKFDSMIGYVLAKDGAARLSDMLWNLQELKQLDEVATNFRSWKQR
jgi:2-methylcitrate dehydratase